MKRIVGLAGFSAPIETRMVRLVEWQVLPVAAREIRIGQKRNAESDEVGFAATYCALSTLEAVTVAGNVGTGELRAQSPIIQHTGPGHHIAFEHMYVGQGTRTQLLQEILEVRLRIGVRHRIEAVLGRQAQADAVSRPH